MKTYIPSLGKLNDSNEERGVPMQTEGFITDTLQKLKKSNSTGQLCKVVECTNQLKRK